MFETTSLAGGEVLSVAVMLWCSVASLFLFDADLLSEHLFNIQPGISCQLGEI